MTDVLVVGAGPAGIAAALWCRSFGLATTVFEAAPRPGGQLHQVYSIVENYPGLRGSGAEIAAALERHVRAAGLDLRFGTAAAGLDAAAPAVRLAGGERFATAGVIVASGARSRALGVPGEAELLGRGVSTSATRDRDQVAGRPVVVVGGGDAAYENALLLADVGCRVTLAIRAAAPRARADFQGRVASSPAIETLPGMRVTAILGDSRVRAVRLLGPEGPCEREVAGVFVKIGAEPNTAWCRDALRCDAQGYIEVREDLRTSAPRVWAAGDVVGPWPPSIARAVGSGARAAAEAFRALR